MEFQWVWELPGLVGGGLWRVYWIGIWDWVNIHFFGNGWYGFRPYGGLLGKTERRPPPSAIQGRGRLIRHSCRVAHCAEPALGLPTGQIKSQSEAA
jgi:hypothetical protein